MPLDFEGSQNSFSIRVEVFDGNFTFQKQFRIQLTNQNEAPLGIHLSGTDVGETAAGGLVGVITSTDSDGPADIHQYSLITDGAGFFQIQGNQLRVKNDANLVVGDYPIDIRATDAGGLHVDGHFTITISEENEPPHSISLLGDHVAENRPGGTQVGTFSTIDPDSGDTFTYSFVAGAHDSDNAAFAIDDDRLVTRIGFDYETQREYHIHVRSTDRGEMWTENVFIITVDDVVEPVAGTIELSNNIVSENLAIGTGIGVFSVAGVPNVTFTLPAGQHDNNLFTIVGNVLRTSATFNFEAQNAFTIRVLATGAVSLDQTFTILIRDVNERPTDIILSNNSVSSQSTNGSVVGSLSAQYEQPAGSVPQQVQYHLLNYADLFGVNGQGQLVVANSDKLFNGSYQGRYEVSVQATVDGQSTIKNVTLAVPRDYLAIGSDAGAAPLVKILDAHTGQLRGQFLAYGAGFMGGTRVATGDVNNDGVDDVITGSGEGVMNSHVKVFDGITGNELRSFFAFQGFLGGVSVASADMNGDGYAEIVVGAGEGGGPHVKVFDGKTNAIIESFFAFDQGYKGGIVVAAGDVNGDGFADLAVMGAKSVAPHIKTYNLRTRSLMDGPIGSFFAYDQAYRGRVSLALADVTGDGKAEFLTGADGSHVRAMDQLGKDVASFFAFGQGFGSAVQVSAVDRSGDGIADLVVGTRDGVSSKVRIFDSTTRQTLDDFFAYDANHKTGVFLGGTA